MQTVVAKRARPSRAVRPAAERAHRAVFRSRAAADRGSEAIGRPAAFAFQPRLMVGAAGDPFEREAETMAARVMNQPEVQGGSQADEPVNPVASAPASSPDEAAASRLSRQSVPEEGRAAIEDRQPGPPISAASEERVSTKTEEETAGRQDEEKASTAEEEQAASPQGDEERASPQEEEAVKAGEEEQASAQDEEKTSPAEEEQAASPQGDEERASPQEEEAAKAGEEEQASAQEEEKASPAEEEQAASPQGDEERASPQEEEAAKAGEEERASPQEEEKASPAEEEQAASPQGDEERADAARVSRQRARSSTRPTPASPEFEAAVNASRGLGKPLPPAAREFMEARFGVEFSDVRIHTDARAAQLNQEISARAFTVGHDIFFAAGRFDAQSRAGRELLAHELTHVLQQTGRRAAPGRRRPTPQVSSSPQQVQGGFLGEKLNKYARQIPGYTLITVLIGFNPLTDKKVPRTAVNLVEGILGLVPGGTLLFDKLNKTGAIHDAFNWLSTEVDKLQITWGHIKALISQAWDEISLIRGIDYNIRVVKRIFGPTVRRIINFAKAVGSKILEFVFQGALKLVGAPVQKVMSLINKGAAVIGKIFSDPIGFVKNLANAVKLGLMNFLKNIKKHLLAGLVGWLFGALSNAGIKLPEKFDLKGVFSLILQILGLTYDNIRLKLVKHLGEKTVSRMEKVFTFVKDLITKGPIVLWEKVKESLTNLKAAVISGVRNWVITKVIKEGITWIIGLLNPVGALIKLIKVLWSIIQFFIERWQQIVDFATSVFDSIAEIAGGNLKKAASAVETALGRTVPVIISFLASLLGLGGISKTIRKVIAKIRKPVDRALDKVIGWLVKKGKALLKKLKRKAKQVVQKALGWLKKKVTFKTEGGEGHTIQFKGGEKNAKLVINSSPQEFDKFLNDKKREIDALEPNDKKSLSDKLEKIRAEHDKLKVEIKKGKKAKDDKVVGELNEIKMKTQKLMEELAKRLGSQKSATPKFGGLKKTITIEGGPGESISGGGFGECMGIKPLTPEGQGTGSSPDVRDPIWKVLLNRKTGGGTYYVAGHLLNDNLGGSGKTWENLTPLTQSANALHHSKVEQYVKSAVNEKKETVKYNVQVNYERGVNEDLIKSIDNDTDVTLPEEVDRKFSLNIERKKIVRAEQAVPKSIDVKAVALDPQSLTEKPKATQPPKFPISEPITNKVESANPGDYQLQRVGKHIRAIEHLNVSEPISDPGKDQKHLALYAYKKVLGVNKDGAETLYTNRHSLTSWAKIEELKGTSGRRRFLDKTIQKWKAEPVSVGSGPESSPSKWNPPL